MKFVLVLLTSFLFVMPALASDAKKGNLASIDIEKAMTEAKRLLLKRYPKYGKSDVRLIEMAARYRPSVYKKVSVEVSFINMDTIGNVKVDPKEWVQPSSGKEMPGVIYEQIVVKLASDGTSPGTVQIINMKYPGTKEQLIRSMNNL